MKRLMILAAVFVALIALYVGLRAVNKPAPFVAPEAVRLESVATDTIDGITFVFAGDKQINLAKREGKWFVGEYPADAGKMTTLLENIGKTAVTSRVSGNKQYHERFDVSDKGVRMTLSAAGEVKKEVILGKAAGGETVYVRLPEQDDVFVMSGLPRYTLSEDVSAWRDRHVATFESTNVRRVQYAENQIQWDLRKDSTGWKLGTNRIAPVAVDDGKTATYLGSIVGLRALDFPTQEQQDGAKKNRATFATVTVEIGSVETFERKEQWLVYTDAQNDRLLLIRDTDNVGVYVNKESFDQAFGDYGQTKTAITLTAAEQAAKEQAAKPTPETK